MESTPDRIERARQALAVHGAKIAEGKWADSRLANVVLRPPEPLVFIRTNVEGEELADALEGALQFVQGRTPDTLYRDYFSVFAQDSPN